VRVTGTVGHGTRENAVYLDMAWCVWYPS